MVDQERAWETFREFLRDRYGSLARAFDIMDTSGDGYLSRDEFMACVTRKERYCRASEALRLFDAAVAVMPDGSNITWFNFGITASEWRQYLRGKQMAKQAHFAERQMIFRGLRNKEAIKTHDNRMKNEGKKPLEAFNTRLQRGWGFPPSYEPPPIMPPPDKSKLS